MAETAKISERLREFILKNFPAASRRAPLHDDALLGGGLIDSLGVLEIVQFIEDEFEVNVDVDDLLPESFETIACMARLVQHKIEGT